MAYWSDNVTNVTNYIATLVASVNMIYERDLNLRLVVGTTFLRVSTTTDPFTRRAGTGNADGPKLSEFSNYWSTNEGGVTRALAALLSGKQASPNSASGIAWLTSLCNTAYGYSFNQLFKINYLSGDTLILGHEIGHNLGSPTRTAIPRRGPTSATGARRDRMLQRPDVLPGVLVINGVTSNGTLMSYCHNLSCGNTLVFHPQTVNNYIGPQLSSRVGACVFPLGGSARPRPLTTSTPTRTPTPTGTELPRRPRRSRGPATPSSTPHDPARDPDGSLRRRRQ